MIKSNIVALVTISLLFSAGDSLISSANARTSDSQNQFFESIKELCGTQYVGVMTYPEKGQDDFSGKKLLANIASCGDQEIRIPFNVGEDKSRTWIISKTANGLELKHDHRHADGTPDEVNMYGGATLEAGNPLSQSFAADQHTATMIPAAATNVWTLEFNQDKSEMIYYLERNAAPRFKAVLQRKEP